MGNRKLKSLKLNGIIVGEYLGSDDYDEDIQAARDLLKVKGLYDPPGLTQAMFGQANQFAYIANEAFIKVRENRKRTGQIVPASAFVVNAAFSLELYLKTLTVLSAGKPWGHELLVLYDALPDALKIELQSEAQKLASEHGQAKDIEVRDLFAMLNEAFEQWRYVYELPRSGAINFHGTLLAMHASREVCKRAVAAPAGEVTA